MHYKGELVDLEKRQIVAILRERADDQQLEGEDWSGQEGVADVMADITQEAWAIGIACRVLRGRQTEEDAGQLREVATILTDKANELLDDYRENMDREDWLYDMGETGKIAGAMWRAASVVRDKALEKANLGAEAKQVEDDIREVIDIWDTYVESYGRKAAEDRYRQLVVRAEELGIGELPDTYPDGEPIPWA